MSILADLLRPADVRGNGSHARPEAGDCDGFWWKDYYSNNSELYVHERQTEFVNFLKRSRDISHLPAGVIAACTVRDPRLFLPKKKFLASQDLQHDEPMESADVEASHCSWPLISSSPLYSEEVRRNVKATMMLDHRINTLRAQMSVPGKLKSTVLTLFVNEF